MAITYSLIASNTLGSSAGTVTFSNIPQTYTDLVFRWSAASTGNSTTTGGGWKENSTVVEDGYFLPNSDYTSAFTGLRGSGSAASSSRDTTSLYGYRLYTAANGSGSTSSTFSSSEMYIPNYRSSTAKPASTFTVTENNGTEAYIMVESRLWSPSTNTAITSIQLGALNGSFITGSSFFLYGIKNS